MTVSSFRSDIPQRLNLFLLRADASCDSAVNTTCDQTNDLHLSVRPCCRLILYQELKRHLMKLKLIPRKERERRLLPRPNTLSCNVIEGEIIGKSESVGSAPTLIDSSLATLPSSHENQARQTKY